MPTLAELLYLAEMCPKTVTCPPPPPASVCGFELGVDVYLQAVAPNATTVVRLECGEWLDWQVLGQCVRVSAQNEIGELVSQPSNTVSTGGECIAVPEFVFVSGLQFGVILLAIVLWRRGRRI